MAENPYESPKEVNEPDLFKIMEQRLYLVLYGLCVAFLVGSMGVALLLWLTGAE